MSSTVSPQFPGGQKFHRGQEGTSIYTKSNGDCQHQTPVRMSHGQTVKCVVALVTNKQCHI